jgi:fimbrial chaperone protein
MLRFLTITAFLLSAAGGHAAGGSLAVSPVRVELSQSRTTAVVVVENQGAAARVYQLETVAWTQANGEDIYTPTRELIAVPPVFQLEAGKKQIVRVGLQTGRGAREMAFRLFIEEVPISPESQTETVPSVQTVLRVGVPVFVSPSERADTPRLAWTVERSAAGATAFVVENPTNVHVQLEQVTLRDQGPRKPLEAGFYLLAGQKRRWSPSLLESLSGSRVVIEAETDQGRIVSEANAR